MLNAQTQYRIKVVSNPNDGYGIGQYLTIFDNSEHPGGQYGGVGVASYTDSNTQIFTYGNDGRLCSADGYYISCQDWNVDAYSKMSNYGTIITGINPDGTFTLSCDKGYFKVEYVSAGSDIYVFCNAGYGVAATWQLEEVTTGGDEPSGDVCTLELSLKDSYGDGWSGCKIVVANGVSSNEFTISDEVNTAQYTCDVVSGTIVTLSFVCGPSGAYSWPDECTWTIKYEDGDDIWSGTGSVAGSSRTFPASCEAAVMPEIPTGLVATAESHKVISLQWDASENAKKYNVYQDGVKIAEEITETSYVVKGLTQLTEYCFSVTAINGALETEHSDEICVTTPERVILPGPQEQEIGEGSTIVNKYLPAYTLYGHNYSQQIYTQKEIDFVPGVVTKIAFKQKSEGEINRNYKVYLVNTTKETFAGGSDWVSLTTDDCYFDGQVTYPGADQWLVITLTEPFQYEGNNILVAVDDDLTSGYPSSEFYAYTTNSRSISVCNDSNDYSISNTGSGTVREHNNQVIFTIEVPSPTVEVNHASLDFGTVRAGGDFWTEKEIPSFNVEVTAKNTTIKSVSIDDDFFTSDKDLATAAGQTEFNFTVSYNKAAAAGEKSGNIVVTYMNDEEEATVEIPMTATAYAPAQGDVVENPIEVTFDGNGVYTYTINSLDGFYDDYVFSPNEQYDVDAKDMVFSFTLTEAALVTLPLNYGWASIYGDFIIDNGPQYIVNNPIGSILLDAGTYYVANAPNIWDLPFEFSITKSSVPAPEIYYSSPYNGDINQNNPTLEWNMQYANEYQVLLGTSVDAMEVKIDWNAVPQPEPSYYTYSTSGLQNNTKYYWQVNARNETGTTTGEVQSFVTLLDVPQITSATSVNLYSGETTTITWEAVANATSYTVYNGWNVLATLEDTETSYELSGLGYNMTGYDITVTAIQDFGESLKSESVVVKVAGTFPLKVNVKDFNDNPIEGATVTFNTSSALDEFQNTITAPEALTTNAEGVAEIRLPLIYNDPNIFGEQIIVYANKTPFGQYFASITPSGLSNDVLKEVNIKLYLPVPSDLVPENDEYMLLAGDNLTLNWIGVDGAIGYNVYKYVYNSSTWTYEYELLGTVTENTYTAVAEYDGEGSYYGVSAVFEGGLESDKIFTSDRIYILGTGDVKGLVTDTEGNPVADAVLELSGTNAFGEDIYILTTESDGAFLFEDVIEGTYSLTVSHHNYEEYVYAEPINVEYNSTTNLEIVLVSKPAVSNDFTVTATLNGDNVDVSWTEGYDGYNVYRRNINAPQELETVATEVTTTSTADAAWETLESGTYQYGVAALLGDISETMYTDDFSSSEGWTGSNWMVTGGVLFIYSNDAGFTRNITSPSIQIGENAPIIQFDYQNSNDNIITIYLEIATNSSITLGTIAPGTSGTFTSDPVDVENFGMSVLNSEVKITFTCKTGTYSSTTIDNLKVYSGSQAVETQIVWSNEVVKQAPVTFEGNVSTDWNVAENWSIDEIPADGAKVIIAAPAVISGNVNVSTVTINDGVSLTVANGGALTVTGTISQASNYFLVLEEGGQIFQNNEGVTARFRMSIDNPTDWSADDNKDGWQFISIPLADVPYTDFTSLSEYDLYKYDGSQDLEWQNLKDGGFDYGGVPETDFRLGHGYLASLKDVETATVYGTLNVSTPAVFGGYTQIIYNEEKDLANFRLFGNPFTYDIYMSDFDLDFYNDGESDFAPGYAVVNESGGYDYRTTEPIKVGEGFFVKAITSTAMTYSPVRKRSENTSNNSLNITATGNAGKDNVVINLAGKSEGFDKLQNFNDAIATVYVAEDGKNYGIYSCDTDVQEVELSFNANKMGNYTISIEPNGKFQTVTLVDRFTGIETNMLLEDYHFTAMSDANTNRFIVKFANGQQTTDDSQFVYQSGEELIINAQGMIQIVDVLGRVVYQSEHFNDINRIGVENFDNASYVVRCVNGKEVKTQKIVIL